LAEPRGASGATLRLKPGRDKSLRQLHPWIFAGGVDRVDGNPRSGHTVRVINADGAFLAYAAFSGESQIRARVWSFDPDASIDAAFIARRVDRAVAARAAMRDVEHTGCRLVHGESDGLPGVIADRYGDVVVEPARCQPAAPSRGLRSPISSTTPTASWPTQKPRSGEKPWP